MQIDGTESLGSHRTMRPANDLSRSRIALVVPKTLVKKIKDALEAHGNLDKSVKIRPARIEEQKGCLEGTSVELRPDFFLIPTNFSAGINEVDTITLPVKWDLLQAHGLTKYAAEISLIIFKHANDTYGFLGSEKGYKDVDRFPKASVGETSSMNPLARTIDHWLHQLSHEGPERPFARDIVLSHSWTYIVYPPLLLLPPNAMSSLSSIFASKDQSLPTDLSSLWRILTREFKVSHVALNAPIPPSTSTKYSLQAEGESGVNILRSPTGLVPLNGDFGPVLSPYHVPSTVDFASGFWCTAQQNGIFQTWAPRYTMFSRGNISEKARILNLETLTEKQLGSRPEETSAVDFYAGIGYFAFSYAKVGVGRVLCWEINPWSVEGLRRGAKRNRWVVEVIKDGQASNQIVNEEGHLIVFQESNEHAAMRIAEMKDSIPPVRHINCGLLPSSKDSWEVAVQVLDLTGGWIHVHENIAKKDIEGRSEEVVGIFNRLVMNHRGHEPEGQWKVECEHVEQVKSYAPGVMHYVLDISISPPG